MTTKSILFIFISLGFSCTSFAESTPSSRTDYQILDLQRETRNNLSDKIEQNIRAILKSEPYQLNLQLTYKNSAIKEFFNPRVQPEVDELPGLGSSSLEHSFFGTHLYQPKNLDGFVTVITVKIRMRGPSAKKYSASIKARLEEFLKNDFQKAKIEIESSVDDSINSTIALDSQRNLATVERIWERSLSELLTTGNAAAASVSQLMSQLFTPGTTLKKYGNIILATVSILLILSTLTCVFLIRAVRKISSQVKETGQSLSASVEAMSLGDSGNSAGPQAEVSDGKSDTSERDSSTASSMERLKEVAVEDLKLTLVLLDIYANSRKFGELMVLLGCVPPNIRSTFLTNPGISELTGYSSFIRMQGYQLLQDEERLKGMAAAIRDLLWIGSQDPEIIPFTIARQSIGSLETSMLAQLFTSVAATQKRLIIECIPTHKSAFLVASGLVSPQQIEDASSAPLDFNAVADLLKAIANHTPDLSVETSKESIWERLGDYLPHEGKSKIDIQAVVDKETNDDRHFLESIDRVVLWINSKSIVESAEFLATVSSRLRGDIISQLPEIKSRRIQATDAQITERGMILKAEALRWIADDAKDIPNVA